LEPAATEYSKRSKNLNAKDFVEHIGLTEDFSAHSPEEKVDVVVSLIKYYGNEFQTMGLIWPLIKLGMKVFPIDAIPNKLLDWNYRGEYQFSSKTLSDAQKAFKDASMSEIEKQKNKDRKIWNSRPKIVPLSRRTQGMEHQPQDEGT